MFKQIQGTIKDIVKVKKINNVPDTLDQKIWPEIERSLDKKIESKNEFIIKNTNRAVGTRISHYLYKKYGNNKLQIIF